jgi:proteic killer suppression protein
VIQSFRCRDTERLFNDESVARFRAVERAARRKLLFPNAARRLEDLLVPPGNRLEKLKGDRAGRFNIRVDHQWRVSFRY